MIKKILAAIFAIIFGVSLAACGAENSDDGVTQVYPERGPNVSLYFEETEPGVWTHRTDLVEIETVPNGTVSVGDLKVTTTWSKYTIDVSFEDKTGTYDVVAGAFEGENGRELFLVPNASSSGAFQIDASTNFSGAARGTAVVMYAKQR